MKFLIFYWIVFIAWGCTHQNTSSPQETKAEEQASPVYSLTNLPSSTEKEEQAIEETHRGMLSIHPLPDVEITYPDAYRVEMVERTFTPKSDTLFVRRINVNGPTVIPDFVPATEIYQDGEWQSFLYDVIAAGEDKNLYPKDTAICTIEPCLFKSPLKPGRYKAIYDFNFQPSTEFRLTDTKVTPVEGSERNWTFGLRVLPSGRDSIHIIWENHTNLKVYLNSCPVIQTAIYKEELHPLPLTIFTREHADWLQEHTTLYGGNAIRLSLPTSWDLDSIPRIQKIIPYKSLPNGRYQVIMPINLEVECEFEIKENKTSN